MCRFMVFVSGHRPTLLADLILHPAHSMTKQSSRSLQRSEGNLNGDGFGVGWYTRHLLHSEESWSATVITKARPKEPSAAAAIQEQTEHSDDKSKALSGSTEAPASSLADAPEPLCPFGASQNPCVFNSVTPAWNNQNLYRISSKISSSLVFAHVRAATEGSLITETNCHPFQWGNYLWMHNGMVAGFPRVKRRILNALDSHLFDLIQGSTDSEHLGLLFLQILLSDNRPGTEIAPYAFLRPYSPSELRQALVSTIGTVVRWTREAGVATFSLLNCAVTDGRSVVVSRFVNDPRIDGATLYYNSGSHWHRDPDAPSSYRMLQRDRRQPSHIIASEPLTSFESADFRDWISVPRNSVIVIDQASNRLIFPIKDDDDDDEEEEEEEDGDFIHIKSTGVSSSAASLFPKDPPVDISSLIM